MAFRKDRATGLTCKTFSAGVSLGSFNKRNFLAAKVAALVRRALFKNQLFVAPQPRAIRALVRQSFLPWCHGGKSVTLTAQYLFIDFVVVPSKETGGTEESPGELEVLSFELLAFQFFGFEAPPGLGGFQVGFFKEGCEAGYRVRH